MWGGGGDLRDKSVAMHTSHATATFPGAEDQGLVRVVALLLPRWALLLLRYLEIGMRLLAKQPGSVTWEGSTHWHATLRAHSRPIRYRKEQVCVCVFFFSVASSALTG